MRRALALGAAAALLLQIMEHFIPATQAFLPLGQDGFIQTAGCMLTPLALWVIYDLFSDDNNDDEDDDGDPPVL